MARVLLLDGDVLVYQSAAAVEKETEWDNDLWTLHSDLGQAIVKLDNTIANLQEELEGERLIVALSDPGGNFRKSVYPAYKSNRKKTRKPIVYKPLRDYLCETYETFERPMLEGDDVLGILSTHPKLVPGEKVIVSIDKDMKTIPGLFYRNAADGLVNITPEMADRQFMLQTLTGDTTDGYPGCPGIGPVKAEAILSAGAEEGEAPWDTIIKVYTKAKLSEDEALVQARCARILRWTDYDFKKKQPILWTP